MANIMIMELALLILLVIVCVYATYTDITQGMIYNHILIPLFVSGIVLDIIYYCKLFPAGLQVFLFNEVVVIGFSVILYALHIWAAGDSKLLILVSLLIPARMTLLGERYYPEILIIAFAFASSFVFFNLRFTLHVEEERIEQREGVDGVPAVYCTIGDKLHLYHNAL